MQLKAKDIGEDGVDVDLVVTPAWLAQNVPDAGVRPAPEGLSFQGRVEPTGPSAGFDEFLVRGKLSGAVITPCGRCLEDARLPLDVDVSVLFVARDEPTGRDSDEDEDPALEAPDVMTFQDGIIDLGAELREELLLAIPTQVLCREECKGLCPVCGGNRNEVPCQCEEVQKQAQSKFAAVAKLKT